MYDTTPNVKRAQRVISELVIRARQIEETLDRYSYLEGKLSIGDSIKEPFTAEQLKWMQDGLRKEFEKLQSRIGSLVLDCAHYGLKVDYEVANEARYEAWKTN